MIDAVDVWLHILLTAALVRVSHCMVWVLFPLRSLANDVAKFSGTGGLV